MANLINDLLDSAKIHAGRCSSRSAARVPRRPPPRRWSSCTRSPRRTACGWSARRARGARDPVRPRPHPPGVRQPDRERDQVLPGRRPDHARRGAPRSRRSVHGHRYGAGDRPGAVPHCSSRTGPAPSTPRRARASVSSSCAASSSTTVAGSGSRARPAAARSSCSRFRSRREVMPSSSSVASAIASWRAREREQVTGEQRIVWDRAPRSPRSPRTIARTVAPVVLRSSRSESVWPTAGLSGWIS